MDESFTSVASATSEAGAASESETAPEQSEPAAMDTSDVQPPSSPITANENDNSEIGRNPGHPSILETGDSYDGTGHMIGTDDPNLNSEGAVNPQPMEEEHLHVQTDDIEVNDDFNDLHQEVDLDAGGTGDLDASGNADADSATALDEVVSSALPFSRPESRTSRRSHKSGKPRSSKVLYYLLYLFYLKFEHDQH